jgi:hypothetical protein
MVLCVKLLKFVADIISVPLAHAFNLSLESGIFPTKLKQSISVSIFKAIDPLKMVMIIAQFHFYVPYQ